MKGWLFLTTLVLWLLVDMAIINYFGTMTFWNDGFLTTLVLWYFERMAPLITLVLWLFQRIPIFNYFGTMTFWNDGYSNYFGTMTFWKDWLTISIIGWRIEFLASFSNFLNISSCLPLNFGGNLFVSSITWTEFS